MHTDILLARSLRREFKRKGQAQLFLAVDGVDVTLRKGEIFCLLGPNGAGKTTTIKMLAALLTPTSGSIQIDGIDAVAQPRQARQKIGLVLGGDRGFYSRASAQDNLLFFADVLGLPRRSRKQRVQEVLEAVSLGDRAKDPVHSYSRGMYQRLHIARGLLAAPPLLLLDEPTNGLDPEIALELRALVKNLAQEGTSILLTTHYMPEAQQLADRLALMLKGKIQVEGNLEQVVEQAGLTPGASLEESYLALVGSKGQA